MRIVPRNPLFVKQKNSAYTTAIPMAEGHGDSRQTVDKGNLATGWSLLKKIRLRGSKVA